MAILLPLVFAACGDDDSPTNPVDQPDPEIHEVLDVTIEVTGFEVLADGDGVEGAGDFQFWVQTPYDVGEWMPTLSTGETLSLAWKTSGTHEYDGEPQSTAIRFICVEWDQNILGEIYADSDMDHRDVTAVETVPVVKTNYITMGNDACRVRLHYRLTAVVDTLES